MQTETDLSGIRVLLFDLGGVLIQNSVFQRLPALLDSGESMAQLRSRWLRSEAIRLFESGRISSQEFAVRFLSEWSLDLSPAEFIDEFRSWPSCFYPGVTELLSALRSRYRIACLSNSNPLHWDKFAAMLGEFDPAISSHQIGLMKPDAAAFEQALRLLDVPASQVAFFDDAPENVAAAAALGIQAFHTDGFAELQAVLARCLPESADC